MESSTFTLAVAIYLGFALSSFFGSITRDLITPILSGLLPGVEQGLDAITVSIGPVKFNIGDAIGATMNLGIAFFVLYLTLPLVRAYSPVGGRR
jgi:large-conductance mechanosensitive channel